MKTLPSCLGLVFFLSGCAAGTVRDLKADPANAIHVEINLNYQRAYNNLVEKLRECIGEGGGGGYAEMRIRHAVLSELREANVSFVMLHLGYTHHYLLVEMKGLDEARTQLDAFVHFGTWRPVLGRIQRWATDPNAPCDVKPTRLEGWS